MRETKKNYAKTTDHELNTWETRVRMAMESSSEFARALTIECLRRVEVEK